VCSWVGRGGGYVRKSGEEGGVEDWKLGGGAGKGTYIRYGKIWVRLSHNTWEKKGGGGKKRYRTKRSVLNYDHLKRK